VLLRTPIKSTILTKQWQGSIHEMEKLLFIWIKMIKRLESLKNTDNKYKADIRPDRLTTCQSERKSVVSRRPSVHTYTHTQHDLRRACAYHYERK
jgi:hypothetical protein